MRRLAFILVVTSFFAQSCGKKGCTDSKAKNYDWEAKKDDGSCEYEGCTDPNSLNYNPDAKEDDGSCKYPGKIQFFTSVNTDAGDFVSITFEDTLVFSLNSSCPQSMRVCNPSDPDACGFIEIPNLEPKTYSYSMTSYQDGTPRFIDNVYVTVESNGCTLETVGY